MNTLETDIAALDLAAIADRIRQMLAVSQLDGREFAQRIGVPYSTMRAYISGGRPPSPEFLVGAFRAFGFMPAWVLAGAEPMTKAGAESPGRDGARPGHVAVSALTTGVMSAPGSFGLAEPAANYVAGQVPMYVNRDWIDAKGLSAANLRYIDVRGTSMEPVLADGDRVLVDLSDTTPRSGFVYAIQQGDELLVKYCATLPGGLLRVSSANGAFPPYDVTPDAAADFRVLGRVRASTHDW